MPHSIDSERIIIYRMADAPQKDSKKEKEEELDFSHKIDKLRESEPHNNVNKFVQKLIDEAVSKTQKEAYGSGFWNGFVVGVVLAFILWTVLTF